MKPTRQNFSNPKSCSFEEQRLKGDIPMGKTFNRGRGHRSVDGVVG